MATPVITSFNEWGARRTSVARQRPVSRVGHINQAHRRQQRCKLSNLVASFDIAQRSVKTGEAGSSEPLDRRTAACFASRLNDKLPPLDVVFLDKVRRTFADGRQTDRGEVDSIMIMY